MEVLLELSCLIFNSLVGLIQVMWVLLIGWNMMLRQFNCHWGHLHEKLSRGERHQLILSQLFSWDALWQLPWHPVTRRNQRLAMEPDSCELTSNEKRETSAALRRSLWKVRNDQAIWGQNCRPSHHQQHVHQKITQIVTPIITPHHHIEHRKNCPQLSP